MSRYFVVAKGTKELPRANNYPWPYEVAICFDRVKKPIGFAEGVGHGSAGGFFSTHEALQPQWREHFALANGEWLLPYVEQLAAGKSIDAAALLLVATQKLGAAPQTYESNGE